MDKSKSPRQLFDSMKKGFGRFYQKAKEESNSQKSKIQIEIDHIKSTHQTQNRYSQPSVHAQGGMKTIIQATDRLTCRQIAIAKMRNDNYSITDLKMFLHEARILAGLNHPNIVPIHDIGIDENNQPYFTMKLLSGESLGCILDRLRANEESYVEKYPLPRLLEIFLKVCDATSFAHSRNVVHRDLKPDNVQVGEFGEVLLCDWGLAKDINLPDRSTQEIKISEILERQTLDGTIKGTPGYMAPEQVDKNSEITEKTDIYALGCMLYSILTLEKSIDCSDLHTLVDSITTGDIIPPSLRVSSNVPKALEAVTLKAMSVNPEERYNNPNEIGEEIKSYLDGFATDAQNADFKTQIFLLIKRNKTTCFLILISFLIITSLVSYFLIELKKRETVALNAMIEAQFQKGEKDKLSKSVAPDFYKKSIDNVKNYNFETALNLARLSTKLDSTNPKAWELLGALQFGSHNFKEATKSLKKGSEKTFDKLIDLSKMLSDKDELNKKLILQIIKTRKLKNILAFFLKTHYQNFPEKEQFQIASELFNELNKSAKLPVARLDPATRSLSFNRSRKWFSKDLDIFHGLNIESADLNNTPQISLRAISSMPLKELNLSKAPIQNINFLKGLNLKTLDLSKSKITDISPLRDQPIESLNISRTRIRNLNILLSLNRLKTLTISEQFHDKQSIIQILEKRGVEIILKE